jgi:uncharacterized protein (TIGR03083 family)
MPQLSPDRYYEEIEARADVLAEIIAEREETLPIPTCPDWTLRQLATHVGRAHRWAAEIIRTRSAEFIPFRQAPDGRFPDEPADRAPWLRAGAKRVVESVQEADGADVWTHAGLGPASYWARRMAHETLMHCADVELAIGRVPAVHPEVAADAIDEWLCLLSPMSLLSPDALTAALAPGTALHVHATDEGLADGEWTIRNSDGAVIADRGHSKGDAAIAGPAANLLLVLLRRLPADDPAVTKHGDPAVLSRWLANTSF